MCGADNPEGETMNRQAKPLSRLVLITSILVTVIPHAHSQQPSAVLSGVPLTINPTVNSLNQGLVVNQNVAGTQGGPLILNNINISDGANLGSAAGLNVNYVYGGTTAQGSRTAIEGSVILAAPTNAANTSRFYVGATFNAQANAGDNGTNTGAGARGSIIGLNSNATATAAATNLGELSAFQAIVFAFSGSSMNSRNAIEVVDASGTGGAQGVTDAGIHFINSLAGGTPPGWKNGILFDNPSIATTGTAISAAATTMDTFINAVNATLTTFIRGPGFVIDGVGNINAVGNINMFGVLSWNGKSIVDGTTTDGIIKLTNNAGTSFGRIQLGGSTASFPAIKRNGAAINFRLADDSGDANMTAGALTLSTALAISSGGTGQTTGAFTYAGSWTPSDQSGANLTFTSVFVSYTQIGDWVCVYGTLTYPNTANGSTALIGGLPVAVPNQNYAAVPGSEYASISPITVKASSTFNWFNSANGNLYTNAQLSLATIKLNLCYPAT
jgi:hypothetical protein